MSGPKKHASVERRIGILKRRIETSLMELTEVEVLINARVLPKQVGDDELAQARLVLTTSIVAMDAELKQLRLSRGKTEVCDESVSSSDESGRVPSETEGGEVCWIQDAKPHVRVLTVEAVAPKRPDNKPAPS